MNDEPEIVPEPSEESIGFDFNALNAETTESIVSDFTAPNASKGKEKRKWWQSAKKERKSTRKPRKPMPTAPRGGLKQALEQLYTGIGMSVMPFDPSCGKTIIENAGPCAESLDELSKTNPAMRRMLIMLVTTSAWGAVIMAHAPIVMAIAMHHVPALREKQEQMVGEFAEMWANMAQNEGGETK